MASGDHRMFMSSSAWDLVALFAVPGVDPVLDLRVGNPLAAIKRRKRFFNAGNLPLVQVEVFVDRLGSEERAASPGTRGQFSSRFLIDESMRTLTVRRCHWSVWAIVLNCVHH